jgi:hypothetical protein
MHTSSALPTFLAATSKFSFPGLYAICFFKKFPDMGRTYPSSLSLKKNTLGYSCEERQCFLFFEWVSQLGGTNMLPSDVSYLFERGGGLISHQVPKKFPSNSSCSHQYPIKILLFSSSSQKFPSNSSCSHQ